MAETLGISVMIPGVVGSGGGVGVDDPDLSVFENKSGLAEDLKFLASMPELCDVTISHFLFQVNQLFFKCLSFIFAGNFSCRRHT